MKRVRQALVVAALTGFTVYAIGAISFWSLTPASWPWPIRMLFALAWFLWTGATLDGLWSRE